MIKRDDKWFKASVEVVCEVCGFRSAVTAASKAWPDCPDCKSPLVRWDEKGMAAVK